jgi:aldose 1-epimerase
MTQVYPLEYGGYRAEIVSTGAGLRMLERDVAGQAWPLTETWAAGSKPPLSAGLVLAPWPSRVTNGFFDFDGTHHQLEITDPAHHAASHGLVRRRDWQLTEHTSNRVTQSIDVGLQPGWPYPLRLTVTHELSATGLVTSHTAHNTGIVPAPFGLGIHTYLRAGNAPIDDCTLEVPASVRLPLNSALAPDGPPRPVGGTEYDFTTARSLRGVWLDAPFSAILSDLDGRARAVLRGPEGPATTLWTEPKFRWLQVFTADPGHGQEYPGRGRALAVEPMTCPPNALNSGIDLIVLKPGETWSASWGLG